MSGSNIAGAAGVYGTLGTAAASNDPGARYALGSWADAYGNLWIFGGYGHDSVGTVGDLHDLWTYGSPP